MEVATLEFDPKTPDETIILGFNFERWTVLLTGTPTVTVARVGGTADANPNAMKLGSPVIQNSRKVAQMAQAGVDGADYEWTCTSGTSDGQTFQLVGVLRVRKQHPYRK